jgi:hypothetical protein
MPDEREQLDPAPIGRLEADAYLEGGWRLTLCLPGKAVVVEQERAEQLRGLWRTALALVVPLVLAVLLVVGTYATPGDMRLVTFPLAGLFLGVVVLGVFALRRRLRQVRDGVRLAVDARTDKVTGMPEASLELARTLEDMNARLVHATLADVEAVRLTVHRNTTHSSRRQRTLANLSLELRLQGKKVTLQGPYAWADEHQWFEARDALAPLGCELSRLCRRALVIDYRWRNETFEVPLEKVDARALPAAFEPR